MTKRIDTYTCDNPDCTRPVDQPPTPEGTVIDYQQINGKYRPVYGIVCKHCYHQLTVIDTTAEVQS